MINVEVGGIDMLRDMAVIKVFYNSHDNTVSNSVDEKMKLKSSEFTEN